MRAPSALFPSCLPSPWQLVADAKPLRFLCFLLVVIKNAISVAPCRNIQSLALHNPTCSAMLAFLAEIPTQHLHTVTFRLAPGECEDDGGTDYPAAATGGFEDLARAIEGERFRRLKTVRFVPDGTAVPGKHLRTSLENVFATLYARGVLHVVEED